MCHTADAPLLRDGHYKTLDNETLNEHRARNKHNPWVAGSNPAPPQANLRKREETIEAGTKKRDIHAFILKTSAL
jgi:hypothetical protein